MSFFNQQADPRELAYGNLVLNTLETLREAVACREAQGETRAEIAKRIGVDRSQLSRTLNGRVRNITLRTISDTLFAAGHAPREIMADPWEAISQSWDREGTCESEVVLAPVITRIEIKTSKSSWSHPFTQTTTSETKPTEFGKNIADLYLNVVMQ